MISDMSSNFSESIIDIRTEHNITNNKISLQFVQFDCKLRNLINQNILIHFRHDKLNNKPCILNALHNHMVKMHLNFCVTKNNELYHV